MADFRIDDCTSQRAPGRLIRRIDKLMRALTEERLSTVGITYSQWATLKLVRDGVVATAGELGRELGYTSGATTRLLDGLEQRGCIERVRSVADRRVVRLSVTAAGEELAQRGMQPVLDLWNEMVADLDQAEANLFIETLLKLVGAIEAKVGQRELPVAEAAE
ncbi:MarR family winged helix-turn-helix transcriptional regulator [Sphingomonas sp.]|uniref:MarR family winged helix-turn-helix transcriptional regulator n=1 Tax=Sphingomonas sp. TaxID=28214 RepID=UPI003AFF6534